ncbi:isocitrate lyase/PEP mutase family protein [Janibacter alittae]|uniref:Isocitrate lyase/PEP mutase family protein n=1 Tax=Janibacter alittae TaxID=3115209 RepID=A0ABZ2MHF0_9MICO
MNTFRETLSEGLVYAPGVWDGLTARLADQSGFSALCASGFAISASLGLPDAEMYSMTENLEAVRRIRGASRLPIVADIDTGYGNAVNAARTARMFADSGVSAVFMEDQLAPKRCPVATSDAPTLLPVKEAAGKIRAVRDSVGDEVVLIGRTDGIGEDAIRRAEAYVEAGAELIMPISRGFPTAEAWADLHTRVGVPLMCSLTAWTWTAEEFTPEVLEQIGVRLALLPTQILLAASTGIRDSLQRLSAGEPPAKVSSDYMEHTEFLQLIGFDEVMKQQETYLPQAIEES